MYIMIDRFVCLSIFTVFLQLTMRCCIFFTQDVTSTLHRNPLRLQDILILTILSYILRMWYSFQLSQMSQKHSSHECCTRYLNNRGTQKLLHDPAVPEATDSSNSSSNRLLHTRHLQQTIHGAANNRRGDATSNRIPKPAKIPITCVRCQITEALE